jgi:hypothetical protein
MTKFAYKRRDIKIIVSGDIVELIQYRVPVNCEKRDYEIVKGSKNDLDKKKTYKERAQIFAAIYGRMLHRIQNLLRLHTKIPCLIMKRFCMI